ncbi:MAG TPA: cytochrome C oxidase subunit IV family protein [Symbiobacteriaceae bacterium]|nr:cytochrome C oxidase subunit IV family protein [Symbiobacteriaceae bacterium]
MAKIQDRRQTKVVTKTHSHPTAKTFVGIGAVLFVLTGLEFGIIYLQGLGSIVLIGLFLLMALKFFLVASYFMHLKWDGKLLGWTFAVGVVLATLITLAQKFVNLA